MLGLTTATAGILVGGIADHYFFNLSFPHSVSIFWIFLALAMVAVRLGTGEEARETVRESDIGVPAKLAV